MPPCKNPITLVIMQASTPPNADATEVGAPVATDSIVVAKARAMSKGQEEAEAKLDTVEELGTRRIGSVGEEIVPDAAPAEKEEAPAEAEKEGGKPRRGALRKLFSRMNAKEEVSGWRSLQLDCRGVLMGGEGEWLDDVGLTRSWAAVGLGEMEQSGR